MPSRTSILETLPKIVNSPPKLKPKSTIGVFENIIFQIRNFGTYHPVLTVGILVIATAALVSILKNGKRKGFGGASGGFFHLDGKEGLLGSGNGAKAD